MLTRRLTRSAFRIIRMPIFTIVYRSGFLRYKLRLRYFSLLNHSMEYHSTAFECFSNLPLTHAFRKGVSKCYHESVNTES